MNYGFIIDNRRCIGCHACTVACKSEHDVPIGVNRTWVKYVEKGEFPHTRRLFSVMRCNHCAQAPCVEICPTSALYTRSDGIVDFDSRRCIACKACMQACPYDALFIDPETHTAQKCNYCAHRTEVGLEPSCVVVCPEQAIIAGDLDNPAAEISMLFAREQVTARKPEKGTEPKLFYIEGDKAALTPAAALPSEGYLWSSQAAGVGHFAAAAEGRPQTGAGDWLRDQSGEPQVLAPEQSNAPDMLQKAHQVLEEQARRVYDAPGEGIVWGWEVAAYIWTKAISAGLFLVPFLALTFGLAPVPEPHHWVGILGGLFFLTLTAGLLIKDLDQPKRFAYVLLRPNWSSWLVRGSYALTGYGVLLTALAVTKYSGHTTTLPFLSRACATAATVSAVYTAFLLAQSKGRDFWQSPVLPLHMVVHALLAGAATLSIAGTLLHQSIAWNGFLRTVLLFGTGANLLVIATDLLMPHATEDGRRTVTLITKEKFRSLFWLGVLLAGNVIPILVIAFAATDLMWPGVLILFGIFCTEHIWIKAPQMIPLS